MLLTEKEIKIPKYIGNAGTLRHFSQHVADQLYTDETAVRFAVTSTDDRFHHCELGILSYGEENRYPRMSSMFNFRLREYENIDEFNSVFLVPTGIGAEIGGHSGDAGPVAKLLASACDNLIVHPNVVNASDINEMPDNALYVEGSSITRLMMGTVCLRKVRSNQVMLIIDSSEEALFYQAAINSASAARAAFGLDCPLVVVMDDKVVMRSLYSTSGRAVGRVEYLEVLCEILDKYRSEFDAVALSSLIDVPEHFHGDYFRGDLDMVNPWGGVEAMLTHSLSMMFDVPSAHSPMMDSKELMNLDVGVVDPRKAAEAVSTTNLQCILKGLHKSPRIVTNPLLNGGSGVLTAANLSCIVIPDGCIGLPTLAAIEQGIPVIAVRENRNRMHNSLEELPFASGKLFVVDNYLEAAGLMTAMKAGVAPDAIRRPLGRTIVHETGSSTTFRQHVLLDDVLGTDKVIEQ